MKALLFTLLAFLATTIQAQDLIVPKQGDPITAYNIEISGNFIFFTTEVKEDATILRIAKNDVLMIRRNDGTILNFIDTVTSEENGNIFAGQSQYPVINEKDIHGSLIAKGNCVYIPTDSPLDYERAGQNQLKENMRQWGYWTVVDRPEQAHFILQFTTQTSGSDLSFIIIRPRKYYEKHPNLIRNGWDGSWKGAKGEVGVTANFYFSKEEVNENVRTATRLAEHLKKMITQPECRDGKVFIKYFNDALNADSETNNHVRHCIRAD